MASMGDIVFPSLGFRVLDRAGCIYFYGSLAFMSLEACCGLGEFIHSQERAIRIKCQVEATLKVTWRQERLFGDAGLKRLCAATVLFSLPTRHSSRFS